MAQKELFVSNNWTSIYNPGYPSVDVKINRLVHVTHITNAENIISSHFKFDASSKYGRSNDSSYKLDRKPQDEQLSWSDIVEKKGGRFSRVSCMESLICDGRFIWWGIEVDCEAINSVKREGRDLSMLFTNEFYYGTVGFSVPFDEVIESYKSSFKPGGKVLFKKAGTLGYKKETCYVILVCVQEEGKGDPLPQFITVPKPYTTGSSICITNPYKWIEGRGKVRWTHYVFAFYFPESHKIRSFCLRPCTVTQFLTEHIQKLCLRRKSEGTCPDQDNVTIDDLCSLRKRCLRHDSQHKIEIRGEVMMNHLNTFLKTFSKRKREDDNSEEHDTDDSEDENSSEEFGQKKAKKRKTTSNNLY